MINICLIDKHLCATLLIALVLSKQPASANTLESSTPDKIEQYWFNGAEISRYSLTQSRYGKEHSGSAEFIFVTEPFLIDKQVKYETGSGSSTPVLKMNALRTFNTGIYSYHTMRSIFTPIDTTQWPHTLKTTTSIQDWCGQVFLQLNYRNDQWQGTQFSYFQDEGDHTFTLETSWLEDEIWTRLRLDPASLPTGSIAIIPGSLFLRFQHLSPQVHIAQAAMTLQGEQATYTLTYPKLGRTLEIVFTRKFPYIIQGWTASQAGTSAVTTATLTHRIEHVYYWSLNNPQDIQQRKKLGLNP